MVVVLASSLVATLGVAHAASTNYVLTGYVDQPGLAAPPVPAGVTVDLVSRATGAVYTSVVTGNGGQFTFSTTSTAGALAPGYWSVYVPAATNTSITGCKPCAVLPGDQNPTYQYLNTTVLTNASYSTSVRGVAILPYNATLNGTVLQGAGAIQGAQVRLLAPTYNGAVLVSNVTNATGKFTLAVPFGTWVLQVTHASGPNVFSNTSSITVASRTPAPVTPVLRAFEVAGHVLSSRTGQPVPTTGNATLFDPTNGFVYSVPTAAGGYYQFSTYPAGFVSGAQTFDVVAASSGFATGWFAANVSGPSTITQNVSVAPIASSAMGVFATTIDLTGVNVTSGSGSVTVTTNASLGNDSVMPGLPNGTVGQLWAQLGLDLNRTLTFPGTLFPTLRAWVAASGPFFPAVQAATTINGTGLAGPQSQANLSSFTAPACSPSCGLTSASSLAYTWSSSYTLNGSIPKNAGSYVLSFRFAHPSSTSDVYNYTLALPAGYVLSAGTAAPSHTKLVGVGPSGTWTHFTLVSQASTTPAATATFTLAKAADLTAIVNISAKGFPFSQKNVLNSSRGSYAISLGANTNATFSAANSTFPSGTNGTSFTWNFGDGHTVTVTNLTTSHTYTGANGSGRAWNGSLTIVSSGGHTSSTTFKVWVVTGPATAKISSNASANRTFRDYLYVPWNTTLQFNASNSTNASRDAWSASVFKLQAKDFNATRNNSVASGGSFGANWSFTFGGGAKPGAGLYVQFSTLTINGSHPTVPGWGWMYNLTLTVWTGSGASATTVLAILVNDTQKPTASILLQGPGGNTIGSNGVVEQANGSAQVRLNATSSSDPGNGSIVSYTWNVTLKGNSSFGKNVSTTSPKAQAIWLKPQNKTYNVTLTVLDKNGNKAKISKSLLVSKNSTLRPIMEAANLTGPSTVNAGSTYTYWVNVTVGGGLQAKAQNIQVTFFLRSASGTGSKTLIAGSPASVAFYGYSNNTSNATVNATPFANGTIAQLPFGQTVRAVISWSPSTSGSYTLYANVTASNEFSGDYGSTNIASTQVSVKQNPTTFLLEVVAVVAVVVVIIGGLVFYMRRRSRGGASSKPSSGRGGLERGKGADDEDDES